MADLVTLIGVAPEPIVLNGVSQGNQTITMTGTGATSLTGSGSSQQVAMTGSVAQTGPKGDKGDTGATGPSGANGTNGQGVPIGGSAGQILAKNSLTDYDTSWIAVPASDKTFTHAFTALATVSAAHNLGKRPAVTVLDSAGDECEGEITHLDAANVTIKFSAPFSGTVICN